MTELASRLDDVLKRFALQSGRADDEQALESVRVAYLGRNGEVTTVRRAIEPFRINERPEAGKLINDAVAAMERLLQAAYEELESRRFDAELGASIDVTFRSIRRPAGSIHPRPANY